MRLFPIQSNLSGASPRPWQIGLIIAIPFFVALLGGAWLAFQAAGIRTERADSLRDRELSMRARSIVGEVEAELEILKTRAQAIHSLSRLDTAESSAAAVEALGSGPGAILLWAAAQRKQDGSGFLVQASLRNPFWKGGALVDAGYLQQALRQLDPEALRDAGKSVLRLKQDSQRNSEWLAILFPVQGGDSVTEPTGRVLLALIDPAEGFATFRDWSSRAEPGAVRAYLVARDGLVLAHSQKAYVASDFSKTGIFTAQAREGLARYQAIDLLPVAGAYVPAAGLPFGVVVERIYEPAQSNFPLEGVLASPITWALAGVLFFALASLVIALGARALFRVLKARRVHPVSEPGVEEAMAQLDGSRKFAKAEGKRLEAEQGALERLAPRDAETFILQELPPSQEATMESPRAAANPVNDAVDAQLVEEALTRELQTSPEVSRTELDRRIAVTRFELGIARSKSLSEALERLARFAHEATASPALILAFDPASSKASLHAAAGLPAAWVMKRIQFSLPRAANAAIDILQRVARSEKQGKLLSLTDYPLLAQAITRGFDPPPRDFEAWALSESGSGTFLGALVILDGGDRVVHNRDVLARAIRSMGHAARVIARQGYQEDARPL
ncbi:MAG: hypothetical protein NDJ90_11970 [Oligoflexia bacterium]|nr:hypothetical protein [Oligoflexia bacterium]